MRFLILLQILIVRISISASENVPNVQKAFAQDEHRQVAVQQLNNSHIRNANEFFDGSKEGESEENNLDFDYNYDDADVKESDAEQEMQEILLKAMRKPTIRKQIGEVVPILRAMSPTQRLTLAALVSSQIMSQKPLSESRLTEVASMFAGKKIESADDRHNITEQLLLPISMDIAQIFRGLGREVGRNLRHNFYTEENNESNKSIIRKRLIRKPPNSTASRRIDEIDYEDWEGESESFEEPVAEALKRPGAEDCDYFTKSLCLEVSNYPTEAIISSLKKNADIAKTFLTDFYKIENERERKPESIGRRMERREDTKNDAQNQLHPEDGYMCPSSVKYARPKRARTTSGHWKYVVNAGDYTQTLRLEICLAPKSPCSFLTNHFKSECSQVYNYHRLLTWDESKGLHMDMFKVPSCCSCRIQGYLNYYPPSDYTFEHAQAQKRKEAAQFAQQNLKQEHPQFNSVGNKREVPVPIHLETEQLVAFKPQLHQQIPNPQIKFENSQNLLILPNVQNYVRDPVDHLIPPIPLPIENEGNFKKPIEPKFYPDKILLEQNRRFPETVDNIRPVKEVAERIIINEAQIKGPPPAKPKIKAPPPPPPPPPAVPSVPQGLFTSQVHLPPPSPQYIIVEHDQGAFESGSQQIRHLGPSPPVNPLPHIPTLEIQNKKPGEGSLFFTHVPNNNNNNKLVIQNQNRPKPNQQHFVPENKDLTSIPSKVRPIFATKPKPEPEIILATTPAPKKLETISPSGQRKINYNYHPIIDFFTTDSAKKSQPKFSPPQYLPITSQGWTPMVRPN